MRKNKHPQESEYIILPQRAQLILQIYLNKYENDHLLDRVLIKMIVIMIIGYDHYPQNTPAIM